MRPNNHNRYHKLLKFFSLHSQTKSHHTKHLFYLIHSNYKRTALQISKLNNAKQQKIYVILKKKQETQSENKIKQEHLQHNSTQLKRSPCQKKCDNTKWSLKKIAIRSHK